MAQAQAEKIQAFRTFASQLAAQVVEQLCTEYEREVSIMWNDLVSYRNELGRVAELLGTQLTRERQLHELVENMAGHHANIASSAQMAAQNQPNARALHEMVDQMFGQSASVLNTTIQGVSQAHAVARESHMSAKGLEEPLINAENEYQRIMQLLSSPLIPGQAPQPTVASPPSQRTPPATPAQVSTRGPPMACNGAATPAQPGQVYVVQGQIQRGPPPAASHPGPMQAHMAPNMVAGQPQVMSAMPMGPVIVQQPMSMAPNGHSLVYPNM
eukprot:TRINITY_DN16231_c0_g1_i2.p2 TRINITY_DN16231_c0_g1~~TRINITY_DN16231_c0_g1_i2.p2  ORF type:complete len:306 (-),score=49.78 TRINITY_DN16231_c0_g1_i2:59-871(-)